MARRARGSLKDKAKEKAKREAKAEDAKGLTRRIRTRTRTGPGETPTLPETGPILSPLEGSKTRFPRPVPGRKRNKELSVARRMGTSLTAINIFASCEWRKNCARRGLK